MTCKKGFININGKCKFLGDLEPFDFPSHSFRNFDVGDGFKEAIEQCNKRDVGKKNSCRSNVRGVYRYVEAGRLGEMGDKIHDFMARLDPDELKQFKEKFPGATKIANEFAHVEDLKKF